MEMFLDSANLSEIESCLQRGVITGITTNPSILAKEPKTDFIGHIKKIVQVIREQKQTIPLSVEVFARKAQEMVAQALDIVGSVNYEALNIKVPIGWDELEVVYQLAKRKIDVNCTCLFTEAQATLAADAGAKYVSIFYGRLKDIGGNPSQVIANTRKLLDLRKSQSKIIIGSIRHEWDITDAHLAGAHIVTASAATIQKMAGHPQTQKSVDGFLKDFEAWLK